MTPSLIGSRCQIGVEVARIAGNLCGQPTGPLKPLLLIFELDLCDHKAGIGAKELIDFPSGSSMLHGVTVLLKGRPLAKGQ
jgi:hypothetical protein